MDPITIVMFALIALLIFFMFRNGKKRQAAMQELQNGLRPGAEVMLQAGIFGTIDSIDEAENRVTLTSGGSTFVVHRNAVSQIVTPSDAPEDEPADAALAPDDDPAFGERVANGSVENSSVENGSVENGDAPPQESRDGDHPEQPGAEEPGTEQPGTEERGDGPAPRA
ncbi:preprotein translocase subunit YajC [Leucobacter sp. wl10]|uniref:preprotein translocase subunit YajC n=1 Tax=Leucobacter sp. wl10 TaxID=2304677 RepID=UPI001F093EEF|nr:preprotein translocase subunit YajC [Leucobacter sp. wl10]